MKVLLHTFVLLSLVQGSLVHSSCQNLGGITWRTWRMQNGFSDHVVNALVVTPDHYLWLGTPRSLLRFDGFHFKDMSGDAAPIIHDFGVTCFYADIDGTLWVGTGSGDLLHVVKGSQHLYGKADGLSGYNIRAMQRDSQGALWIAAERGMFVLRNQRFQQAQLLPQLDDPSVRAMVSDGAGGLWIGGHLLIHYSKGTFENIQVPFLHASLRIETLAMGTDGTLWIGTLEGLFRKERGSTVKVVRGISTGVDSLLMGRAGRLWIGTVDDGVFLLTKSGKLTHLSEVTEGQNKTILALSMDDSEDIWIGTQAGLIRLSDTGMHLHAIPATRTSQYATLALDHDASLWIAAGKVFHLTDGRLSSPRFPLVEDVPIRAILRDNTGALWVGTAGKGAIRIPPKGPPKRYAASIGTSYVTGFLQGVGDDVWVSSESGVAVWRHNQMISFQKIPGAPHQSVNCIALVGPDDLWLGTSHGLLLLHQGQFVSNAVTSQFGSHAVRALYASQDGTLWIGTESGLFRLKNQRLQRVPVEYGTSSHPILSIFEDKKQRLWLGSLDSVRRIECAAVDRALSSPRRVNSDEEHANGENINILPETFAVSSETGAELYGGLQSSSVSDGRTGAWFISDAGPIHITGIRKRISDNPPPVVLEQVVVDGQKVDVGNELVLSPSTKTLELEATPVLLSSHTGLQIRRQLIGFDNGWTTLPGSHIATYTSLPPGKYIFKVEAFWPGQETRSSVELRIVQQAHFYRKGWFLSACVAMALVLVWCLHRYKLQQIAARFSAVAEERNRVAREMHDTLLQGCIGVSLLLDGIDSTQRNGKTNGTNGWIRTLDMARAEIDKTISEARAAIWGLRQSETEAHLDRALRELMQRTTKTLAVPVSFKTSGPSLRVNADQRREILLAVREALRNSIRHAHPTRIDVNLCYSGDSVKIEVTDQGCGISTETNEAATPGHFGMIGMRERMRRIGGRCAIHSRVGYGTTVILELPIHPTKGRAEKKI